MTILIESAITLDTQTRSEIEAVLTPGNALVTYTVNPAILGGLRVTMDGKRIDLSLAGKVHQIAKKIAY